MKCIVCAQCFLLLGVTIIFLLHVGNRTSCISAKIPHSFNDTERKRLFYGTWMTGQRQLNQTCNLEKTTRMKCCKSKQNLRFVFNNDKFNQINPVEEMRRILQKNSIFFIGDSLMREFTFGIGELLGLPVPFNSTKLNFMQANQIFTRKSPPSLNSSGAIPEAVIRHALRNYDVIVFNQGLHYMIGPTGLAAYQYRCVGELLQDIALETNKKVRNARSWWPSGHASAYCAGVPFKPWHPTSRECDPLPCWLSRCGRCRTRGESEESTACR